MRAIPIVVILGILFALPYPISSQNVAAKKEPLVDRVKNAIDSGTNYLLNEQRDNGSWPAVSVGAFSSDYLYGGSCLAMLALMESGVSPEDQKTRIKMQQGLDFVRRIKYAKTYVVALQTMVLAKAGRKADQQKIEKNVEWLIKAAHRDENGNLLGWTYDAGAGQPDNSNTQYALLGLLAGKQAGIKIDESVWKSIRDYYVRTQLRQGGWGYHSNDAPRFTMGAAGFCGLLISGMQLKEGRETLRRNIPAQNCGQYQENAALTKAVNYLGARFQIKFSGRSFYNLYGIERAGRLSGLRFIGAHDWYREGCDFLVRNQRRDGSWSLAGGYDNKPVVSTAFALLFLSKGRTPILISRVAHGDWPRRDSDWNNDRYALRNLTKYASKNLFKNMRLGWQNFDVRAALSATGGAPTEDDLFDITSELLQSPILFINGHKSPLRRFSENEIDILRRYVESGGFIVAEACCGSKEFDAGFRKLVKRIYPNSDLQPLPATHAIWLSHFKIGPGAFNLHGLDVGCKTVLVYAPEDMSCRWEANDTSDNAFDGGLAFRVGANIIAYATGLEPPLPRLTPVAVRRPVKLAPVKPGYFKAARISYKGKWDIAPNAMRVVLEHLRQTRGLDTALKPETMPLYHPDITNFKFLYLHGKGDPGFDSLEEKELDKLKFNLETGALLFADAGCGNALFDKKFRAFLAKLFPEHKLQRVRPNDVLFKEIVGGENLTRKNIRYRHKRGEKMQKDEPWLEGIQIDGQWVVLYSKYDIGCALEKHQSSDCMGYDYPSALRISRAAILYLLRPFNK